MRTSISLAMLASVAALAVASPVAAPPRPGGPPVGVKVASVGRCPMDCWNEAASRAGCDPNTNDDCLCGPFFDKVTYCTAATCGAADNLATLNFLQPAC